MLMNVYAVRNMCFIGSDIRHGKVDSQFIVTAFPVLHAGGRSLFIFHIGSVAMLLRHFTQCRKPQTSLITTDHGTMQRLLLAT